MLRLLTVGGVDFVNDVVIIFISRVRQHFIRNVIDDRRIGFVQHDIGVDDRDRNRRFRRRRGRRRRRPDAGDGSLSRNFFLLLGS